MCVNTKAIIKYWKQSIGLHKSYLKTLEIDKLEVKMQERGSGLRKVL